MTRSPSRAAPSAHLLAAIGFLLITAGFEPQPAAAQSFDCGRARHVDEMTICQDPGLGQLDQELAAAYDRVIQKLPKEQRNAFDNNETAFVTARHRCGEHRGCIAQSYRNRLRELQQALSAGEREPSGGVGNNAAEAHPDRRRQSRDESGPDSERQPFNAGTTAETTAARTSPDERQAEINENAKPTAERSRAKDDKPRVEKVETARGHHAKHSEDADLSPPTGPEPRTSTPRASEPERSRSSAVNSRSEPAATVPASPPPKRHAKRGDIAKAAAAAPNEPNSGAAGPAGSTSWVNPAPAP